MHMSYVRISASFLLAFLLACDANLDAGASEAQAAQDVLARINPCYREEVIRDETLCPNFAAAFFDMMMARSQDILDNTTDEPITFMYLADTPNELALFRKTPYPNIVWQVTVSRDPVVFTFIAFKPIDVDQLLMMTIARDCTPEEEEHIVRAQTSHYFHENFTQLLKQRDQLCPPPHPPELETGCPD